MELTDMNLEQVIARLAELDEEVRIAESVDAIEAAKTEKVSLLERKAELDELEQRRADVADLKSGKATAKVIEVTQPMEERKMDLTREEILQSAEYRSGFLKALQRKTLSDIEERSIASTDVLGAIPTQTYDQIMSKIKQTVPLLDEITLLNVAGNVNFAVEGTNNAAILHSESGEVTALEDTLVTVSLGGYEIVKLVRISATVQTMTVNAFESWLTDQLGESVARVIENYIINGTGDSEPKGIAQAQTWSDGTNGVDWAGAAPTYAEIVELIGYLPGGYARNAKFLMNHKTYWTKIQNIRDDGKYPVAKDDNGIHRIMGFPVLFSDYCEDGDIFFGDYSKVVGNLAQNINVSASAESGFIYNAIDYRGVAIFDCDVAIGEAIVKGEATLSNS